MKNSKRKFATITILALCLGSNAVATAATLNGIATNGTTGQPAEGDVVILKSLAGSMTEIGRGRTNARGGFQFTVTGTKAPYLVSVIHQGVSYQSMALAAGKPVGVQVYDAATTLDGVMATRDVQRIQTDGDYLQVIEEIAVLNASEPPRTLANDRPFEIQLPPEAEVVDGKYQVAGWNPVTHKPAAGGEKGRYYFRVPLGPGESRFAIAYQLPYAGKATIEPKILYPLKQLVIILPETMRFEAKSPGVFQPALGKPGAYLQETAAIKSGASLAFRIAGTGKLEQPGSGRHHPTTSRTPRPAGALAAPAKPLGPLESGRWFLLGGLVLVLTSGAAVVVAHKRKQRALRASPTLLTSPARGRSARAR